MQKELQCLQQHDYQMQITPYAKIPKILHIRTKLSKKAEGKTQIIITQRVTSAMNSDIILVMDNGNLVDSGKHSELLERCEIYREIYASQTGGGKK